MAFPDRQPATLRVARIVDVMPRRGKQLLMVAWDASVAPICLWLALGLRLGTLEPPPAVSWLHFAGMALVVPPVFWAFGLYREITRYIGPRYAWLLAQACLVVTAVMPAAVFLAPGRGEGMPRTAPLIDTATLPPVD